MSAPASDAVVVGAGLVGLACALAIADRGGNVVLVGSHRQGESSPAAAGMLAPSVEGTGGGPEHLFAVAARDRYPSYLAALAERTGKPVTLNRDGILVVGLTADDDDRLAAARAAGGEEVDQAVLSRLEPALGHARGAVYFPHDGAVDNQELLRVLRVAVEAHPRIRVERAEVRGLSLPRGEQAAALTADGRRLSARRVVLAAGAWVNGIEGLPRAIPVEPVRGQMIALGSYIVRHVVYGPRCYLVPRPTIRTLVGATMERVGFDARTTDEALDALRREAEALFPPLREVPRIAAWAGLRPVTPDLHPIIGPDPDAPALVYACGHSRNGVLMAPLTGDVVAETVLGERTPPEIGAFGIARFG